jgi:hypothetical protein
MGQMANQLAGQKPNTMANAPVSKTNVAKPGNPNAATPAATPKKNLGFGFNTDTGEPFSSAEERTAAGDAGTDAASLFPTAAPTATKARGGKVAGQVSQTPGAIAKRGKRQAAASASSAGNKAMGNMVNTLQQQNASKDNYGNALSEALARQIDVHKQKMFETGLSRGSISVFRK